MLYPESKYNKGSIRDIANVIGIETSNDDVAELICRLTFNVLIGNADMHLKNWLLIYSNPTAPSLAPGYEVVSTISYLPDDKFARNVSRIKVFSEIDADEMKHLAARAKHPEKIVLDTHAETIELFHKLWPSESANLPIHEDAREAVKNHLKTVPTK